MSAPFLSILTTYSPAQGMRARVQALAAYSLSLVEDAEVIVLDESGWANPVCEQYGFKRMTGMKTGKDVGVPGGAWLMDDGFRLAGEQAHGEVIMFLCGDNIVWSGDLAEKLRKINARTEGDFICLGRRLDLQNYEDLLWGDLHQCYLRLLACVNDAKRIPYGVDQYIWSRSQFEKMDRLPLLVDGFFWDNAMVTDAWQKTSHLYYLAGVLETIHCVHKDSSVRQVTVARPSSEHNLRVVTNAYQGLEIRKMETPPIVPKEWLE
jgi:hypothetical protein